MSVGRKRPVVARALAVVLPAAAWWAWSGCYRSDIRTIVVRVPQLRSAECARLAQNTLGGLEGILTVQPDLAAHTLTVTYDSRKLAIKNIEYALAAAGFDANDALARPEARAKLPEPCR